MYYAICYCCLFEGPLDVMAYLAKTVEIAVGKRAYQSMPPSTSSKFQGSHNGSILLENTKGSLRYLHRQLAVHENSSRSCGLPEGVVLLLGG